MSNERRWKADAAAIDADAEAELSRGGSKGAMVARDKHPKQRAFVAFQVHSDRGTRSSKSLQKRRTEDVLARQGSRLQHRCKATYPIPIFNEVLYAIGPSRSS